MNGRAPDPQAVDNSVDNSRWWQVPNPDQVVVDRQISWDLHCATTPGLVVRK